MNNLTLATIGDGTAEQLFQAALERVLSNIDDPAIEPAAKRSITLTFSFEVDDDRRAAKMFVQCATKLGGTRPQSARIMIGRHEGKLAAVEAYKQEEMFPSPQGRPALVEGA